jgi:hypothetical protein
MLWIGLAVSLCYIPGLTGAYIATQWPLLAVILPFGLLRRGPFTVFHLLGLLFFDYAAVHILWSPNPYGSVYGVWLLAISALVVWFGTTLEDPRDLYKGLAIGAILSSFVAVLQFFGIGVVPVTSTMPAGLYVNSVQQGTVLALVAVALMTERMWPWIPPLLPGIWLSHSRGGAIVLLVGLLCCCSRRLWIPAGVIAMAASIYLFYPLSPSDSQRLYIWHVAWDNLTLFGFGAGAFFSVVFMHDGVTLFPEYAHNDFLQFAFEFGIGAVLPAIIIGYAVWRTDVKEWPVVLAFCTAACFSMPLSMPIAAFLSLVAVGRVLRAHGLHGSERNYRGYDFLSWDDTCRLATRGRNLSVASQYSAKG